MTRVILTCQLTRRNQSLIQTEMCKYTYDDLVRVSRNADKKLRPGEIASVVAVFNERPLGGYFDQFPPGVIYSIEFEDGEATEIHESDLELEDRQDRPENK